MRQFINDMMGSGWVGWFTVVWIIVLLAAFLNVALSEDCTIKNAVVKNVEFVPAHTSTTSVSTGKSVIVRSVRHPDKWVGSIVSSEGVMTCDFKEVIEIGEVVNVKVQKGFIFNNVECRGE